MEGKALDFRNILKGILLSFVISIVAVGVLSVFVYFINISDKTVNTLILMLSALSVFFGALTLAKNTGRYGLVNGLILAAGYFAVLIILSFLINGRINLTVHNVLRLTTALAAGMLGGIMGVNSVK